MLLYLKQTSCSSLCAHVRYFVFIWEDRNVILTQRNSRICPLHKLLFPKNLILSNSHIHRDKEFGRKKVITYFFLPDDSRMISIFDQWKIMFFQRSICWHLAVEEISIKKKTPQTHNQIKNLQCNQVQLHRNKWQIKCFCTTVVPGNSQISDDCWDGQI